MRNAEGRVFVALLRAVNVGGTGKLAMTRLKEICADLGFTDAATYIQSGNVIFRATPAEKTVKAKLEKALAAEIGKPCGVMVRTAAELEAILESNPFKKAAPNRVIVVFLDEAPEANALATVRVPGTEELSRVGRELFVHFPDGMGTSKLKVPFAAIGTGRNVNTVTKLLAMATAMGSTVIQSLACEASPVVSRSRRRSSSRPPRATRSPCPPPTRGSF